MFRQMLFFFWALIRIEKGFGNQFTQNKTKSQATNQAESSGEDRTGDKLEGHNGFLGQLQDGEW